MCLSQNCGKSKGTATVRYTGGYVAKKSNQAPVVKKKIRTRVVSHGRIVGSGPTTYKIGKVTTRITK